MNVGKSRVYVKLLILVAVLTVSVTGILYASAQIDPFPVIVTVDDGVTIDTIYLADHGSILADGNYITLSQGDVPIDLPSPAEVDYTGPLEVSRHVNGYDVTVTSEYATKNVISPIDSWELYYAPATVDVTFYGDSRLADDVVEIRLLTHTYSDVLDALSDAKDGDTQPLKDLLADYILTQTRTLNADGDFDTLPQFTMNDPGDYAVVVIIEETNPYKLWVYSAAPVEVLDYEIDVTPDFDPAAPEFGIDVYINFIDVPTGTKYSYGSVLIREDTYSLYAVVNTDGTVDGTTVDVRHQGDTPKPLYTVVTNGEVLGIHYNDYMDLLDYDLLNAEIGNVFNLDEHSLGSNLETSETQNVIIGLDSDGFQGTYILTTIVWEHDTENRIVGFDQQEIILGQAVTLDSTTSDLPQAYANLVTIDYQITSSTQIVDATAHFEFSIDGVLIPDSTTDVTIQINAETKVFQYTWDTLLDVPRSYKAGGAIDYTITIRDGATDLATISGSGTMTAASKATVFVERLNPLSAQWAVSTPAEKGVIFNTYINPLSILWAEL